MSADITALPAVTRRRRAALGHLTLTELTLFLRDRTGVVWGVGLPLVLLIIFGNIPGFRKPVSPATPGVSVLDAYVPVLLSFVLAMIALNVLPPVLAGYREKGVLRRLSATPVGAPRVLAAQLIVDAGMAAVTMIVLLVVARQPAGPPSGGMRGSAGKSGREPSAYPCPPTWVSREYADARSTWSAVMLTPV